MPKHSIPAVLLDHALQKVANEKEYKRNKKEKKKEKKEREKWGIHGNGINGKSYYLNEPYPPISNPYQQPYRCVPSPQQPYPAPAPYYRPNKAPPYPTDLGFTANNQHTATPYPSPTVPHPSPEDQPGPSCGYPQRPPYPAF
ncbi:hypothetical protein L596_029549 [Steinernema carpocapsae]|uniref:Uncharacterized protein n=1 Tax=Steinernema carpocapsae TaxID=34508 RepID=A0A4V5ZXI8_STECR|nr:hypothetical protein L596_029549 [Steinernema carpocapsae]